MNLTELNNTLSLIEAISSSEISSFQKGIVSTFELVGEVEKIYQEEKGKLPYHLNLIDELRANENAHSRILVKLLHYKLNKKESALQSFIDFVKEKNKETFEFDYPLNNCSITVEKQRIDALIYDKNNEFSIIIENKINGALDQDGQILSYIEKVEKKVKREQIYVVYLTRQGGQPSLDSFPEEEKEKFKEGKRYVELSYRADIIDWLENFHPSAKLEEEQYMMSALHQYIDHLKGLFDFRKINANMNQELLNVIERNLELGADLKANVDKIRLTLENLERTKGYLEKTLSLNWINFYHEQMKKDYPNDNVELSVNDNFHFVCIVLTWKEEIKFSVSIECYLKSPQMPYIGVSRHHNEEKTKNGELEKFLAEVIKDYKKTNYWYGLKHISFENTYAEFKQLFDRVLKKIQSN